MKKRKKYAMIIQHAIELEKRSKKIDIIEID